jgi:electron transfer flavoprotein alpha subunit
MSVLVIAEHNNKLLKPSTLVTITAANELSDDVSVLVAGHQCEAVVSQLSKTQGVKKVLQADHTCYAHPLAETLAPLIVQLSENVDYVLAPATTFGKNVLPRVAAMLDVGQVSDIIKVIDENTFMRPIYAGNAIATVRSHDKQKVITVRPTAFSAADVTEDTVAVVENIDKTVDNRQSSFAHASLQKSDRPELGAADIIISGGRGLKDKESFDRLTAIADRLGAAIGASRAAVDAGLAPNDYQVGQTGQVVAPKLYIAVGISGAIQHLAGMKDSKVIVAINKDPDAPIFQIADYGLVADLFEVLPLWEQALTELGY